MLATIESSTTGLTQAVNDLAVESIDNLPTHVIGDGLVAIRREIDRLEAQFIRRLDCFDQQRGATTEGAVSTASWLRSTCGLTGAAATDRLRVARALNGLAQVTGSFCAGRSPYTNISLIARLAENVGVEATRTVEETLVTAAEKLDAARMWSLTEFTRHRLDADGALDKANRDHDRRWFACDRTFGGMFVLRGELDAEGGAIIKTALDALSVPAGPGDERSGSQRRADALVDLASRQLKNGELPTTHGQRPHLTLTASLETLRRDEGAVPAELRGVGPIHAETARRVACDSVGTLVTTDSSGSALSVGRASRSIPASLRTALALRDNGCRFPGCDRPPEWTDGHHVKHWADRGKTEMSNLLLLCRRHHRMVHERGWHLRLDVDGALSVEEPPGKPVPVRRL